MQSSLQRAEQPVCSLHLSVNGKVFQHSAHKTFLLFWREKNIKPSVDEVQLAKTCTNNHGGSRLAAWGSVPSQHFGALHLLDNKTTVGRT